MKTRQNINYEIVNGQYTIDGYDFFDTLEELEADIDNQLAWTKGETFKDADGWHPVSELPEINETETLKAELAIHGVHCNDNDLRLYVKINASGLPVRYENDMTGAVAIFPNMTALLTTWTAVSVGDVYRDGDHWEACLSD